MFFVKKKCTFAWIIFFFMHKSKKFIRKIVVPLQFMITRVIDFFYPPFRKIMPLSVFRYGVTGVTNMAFDWALYFIFYNFIFRKENVNIGIQVFTPHVAALFVVFPITFFSGFLLSKYISFSDSFIRGRVQLFRYMLVVAGCLLINYVLLKIFVEICGFYPTPSKMLITPVSVAFSYFAQRHFTFQSKVESQKSKE